MAGLRVSGGRERPGRGAGTDPGLGFDRGAADSEALQLLDLGRHVG